MMLPELLGTVLTNPAGLIAPSFNPTPLLSGALGDFVDPRTLVTVFVDGLAKSAIYIMVAIGLTLIFGLLGVLNFAHGSFTMIGAYLGGLIMVVIVGSSPGLLALAWFFVSVIVVFGVVAGLGVGIEIGLIRSLYDRSPLYQILLTFGITLVLEELMRIILLFYGMQPLTDWQEVMGTKPAFLTTSVKVAGFTFDSLSLFQIAFGVVTTVLVWTFLTRTRYGLIVRAGSEDDEMTEALGIDVRRVFTTVFAIGAGIAGVAGTLLMWDPVWGASVPLAVETLLPAFVVVIVGGLGTFRGTIVAGIIVGMVDATMTWWFQNAISFTG
ncbi:MAG: branched-chain amino acid ABC transporter permease, partial [Halodesulfurarchaeum sp.]